MMDPRLIIGLSVAAVAGLGGFGLGRTIYMAKLDKEVAARAAERAAAADALQKEVAKNLEIERAAQKRVDDARTELESEKANNAALAATAPAGPPVDVAGLRSALARARDRAASAAQDARTACDLRSAAYEERLASGAQLLDEGRRLAVEVARDADDRRAEVRALLQAWPR